MKKTALLIFVTILAIGISYCADRKNQPTWTDPEKAAAEDPAFTIQGEYGVAEEGRDWGIQVVALGGNKLDAYILKGGLPGLGYEKGTPKIKLAGQISSEGVLFTGKDQAGLPYTGKISDQHFVLRKEATEIGKFPKVVRKSPTLGKPAPDGATILFDGSNAAAWNKENLVEDGLLKNNDISTRKKFGSYQLHLEFRTPYKPYARGQGRGNSGVYHQGRYETQVLDAFGLEGKMNETGGLYSIKAPDHNMCLPPLEWQTYDVELVSAEFDAEGNLKAPGKITVRLNGVLIHENVELSKATPGHKTKFGPGPGAIFIQGHGNPVYYRNIWLVER